jgi:tetratricopeptide (TPR) repeat protein
MPNEALHYFLDSLSLLEELHCDDHLDIAGAYNSVGRAYRDIGDLDQSVKYHLLALAMYGRANLPNIHPDIANCMHNMAIVHHDREEFEQARALYEKSLTIRKQCHVSTHPDIASNLTSILFLY